MGVACDLRDLKALHPRLVWDEIAACAEAVLGSLESRGPVRVPVETRNVPGYSGQQLFLEVRAGDNSRARVAAMRRTYEPGRLVELAAIAVTGLSLYHGGGHEIVDVGLRGSAADYLVDGMEHCLEIAGRSSRSDFEAAWKRKWQRLSDQKGNGLYVCVVEFETPVARLSFHA